MDYDFNERETSFFSQIDELMQSLGEDSERRGAGAIGHHIRYALKRLAETPYLKLGLDTQEDLNGLVSLMGAMQIVSSLSPSLFLSIEMSTRVYGRTLKTWGNPEQKERWLVPLLKGETVGAIALSEDSLNVENEPLKTKAKAEGDTVVISGRKQYVVNGPVADWIAVAGATGDKNAIFLIERDAASLELGDRIPTVGYEGATICSLFLENCRIPADQVVGHFDPREGLGKIRLWENQVILGASLGLMKAAYESARNYAKTHESGGKPVIAYQEVGFKLAEMLTLLQTSQLFAYRAAWTAEAMPEEADSLTLCAKVFCAESAEEVAGKALQILGGSGYVSGNAAERAYRCSKYGQIAGTSTEIARVKIGDHALGGE